MRGQSGFAPLRGNDFPKPLFHNVWSNFIMSSNSRLPAGSSLMFSRRELPKKLLAIGAALLLPKRQREVPLIQTQVQPKFKIGDLVAEDWVNDDDEVETEFGQILGMSYCSKAYSCFEENSWIYYVCWTHSTCGADFAYPTYDQEATSECDLRLIK